MIVKVGESLGETFGNFVGRLAATLAVLTLVILAFRASVLAVHPVLPDCNHAAMLTMVKDGSWFSPNPPMDGARIGEGGEEVTDATVRARIRVDWRLAGGLSALLGVLIAACDGCGERDGGIGHGKKHSRTGPGASWRGS